MNRVFAALAVLLIGVSVGAGLVATGGPQEGRVERQDAQRMEDLDRITRWLRCPNQDALPQMLEDTAFCPDARGDLNVTDPATGQTYDYRRLTSDRAEICVQLYAKSASHKFRFRTNVDATGRACNSVTRNVAHEPRG